MLVFGFGVKGKLFNREIGFGNILWKSLVCYTSGIASSDSFPDGEIVTPPVTNELMESVVAPTKNMFSYNS